MCNLNFTSMKKVLVSIMVMVAISTATFALTPSDYGVFYKLNDKSTFTSVVNYLKADKEQADYLKLVFNATADGFKDAAKTGNDKLADNVLDYNLLNTKSVLSEDQYKKYLVLINLSINNKSNDLFGKDILISENSK